MSIKIRFLVPSVLILLTIYALFALRVQNSAPLWNKYRVLAVDVHIPEQKVLSVLTNSGVKNIISASSAYVKESYSVYFYDKLKTKQLFYLENTNSQLKKAVNALKSTDFAWEMDNAGTRSFIPLFFFTLLGGILLYFSKKRHYFLCLWLPLLLLCVCNPASTMFLSVIFLSFAAYVLQDLWNKPDVMTLLTKNVLLIFITGISILSALFSGLLSFFLFFCALLCSLSLLSLLTGMERYFNTKKRFQTIPIRAVLKRDFHTFSFFKVLVCTYICAGFVMIFFVFFAQFVSSSGISLLSLPVPTQYTKANGFSVQGYFESQRLQKETDLPALDDYVRFSWEKAVSAYTKLFDGIKKPQNGEKIQFSKYIKNTDGTISVEEQTIQTFDNAFLKKVMSNLEKNQAKGIEYVWYKQGRFFTASYANASNSAFTKSAVLPSYIVFGLLICMGIGIYFFKADLWLQ